MSFLFQNDKFYYNVSFCVWLYISCDQTNMINTTTVFLFWSDNLYLHKQTIYNKYLYNVSIWVYQYVTE